MRASRVLLLSLALAGPSPRAEGSDERGLSLATARALATTGGPEVLLARRREDIARAQVEATGALANPTLSLLTARLSARLSTGLSVPLPLFGQRSTAVAAARADVDVAALDTEALRVDARWNATRAWLDLWEAQQRASLLALAATEAERLATIAQERFAAGSTPRLDTVRTSADRARARADASASTTGITAASARLSQWLGDAEEPTALRAAGAPSLGDLPPQESALRLLLERHPILAHDRAAVVAAATRVRAERRLRWPLVNAQVTVSRADPTLPGTDVIGGVAFEAPVLSQRAGAIARARAEQALAETTIDTNARRLSALLSDAYEQAKGASLRARALEHDVLPALEESRRMTEEGYRDGRVNLLRVLDTQRVLLEGRVAHLDAQASSQRALADLERALGVPLAEVASGAR